MIGAPTFKSLVVSAALVMPAGGAGLSTQHPAAPVHADNAAKPMIRQLTNADYVDPLNRYLAGTPMAGTGQDFWDAEQKYGVKKELLMAIAFAETNYNRHPQRGSTYNAFSICSYDSTNTTCHYGSYREAIMAAADTLTNPAKPIGRMPYHNVGDLSRAGNPRGPIWASSPSNWNRNVTTEISRITGQPADWYWTWRKG